MYKVVIAGHLGKDPESRFTPKGEKVTSFSVAANVRKGQEDVVIWTRVTVWGEQFDKRIEKLKKGSAVVVWGKMSLPSHYEDKEGRTQVTFEVTAIDIEFSPFGRPDRSTENSAQYAAAGQSRAESPYGTFEGQGQYQMQQAQQYSKAQASYDSQTVGQGSHQSMDDDQIPF